MKHYTTRELRAIIDTCHRLEAYDSWFEALCKEYNTRMDGQAVQWEKDD